MRQHRYRSVQFARNRGELLVRRTEQRLRTCRWAVALIGHYPPLNYVGDHTNYPRHYSLFDYLSKTMYDERHAQKRRTARNG